jgi:hypothetical protein
VRGAFEFAASERTLFVRSEHALCRGSYHTALLLERSGNRAGSVTILAPRTRRAAAFIIG